MTIQRLLELATTIARREGGDLIVQVKTVRQVSDTETVEFYENVKDLCLSKEGVLLIRT